MKQQMLDVMTSITGWGHQAYSCGPESHALAYTIVAMAMAISAGGVYMWKHHIRTAPPKTSFT